SSSGFSRRVAMFASPFLAIQSLIVRVRPAGECFAKPTGITVAEGISGRTVVATSPTPQDTTPSPRALAIAAYVICGAVIVLFLRYAEQVFVPIVLAVLIGYALDPLVTKIASCRIPRPAASVLV